MVIKQALFNQLFICKFITHLHNEFTLYKKNIKLVSQRYFY